MKEDDDLVITDEDVVEEENNTEEEETIEESEVSEESESAIIPDEEEDEEEEDRIVTIGDSTPEGEAEEDEHKEAPEWVKATRKSNRKLLSENKRLKRELEENAKAAEISKPVELGEKPTLKNSGYDEAKFEQSLIDYDTRKRKVEEQATAKAKTIEEQNVAWQNKHKTYVSLKEEHNFKDYADVEELVINTFSQAQQSIIIQGADDSALLVYALGKNTKKLEELAKIKDPVDFAFKVAKLESQLKVTNKKAPKPETRVTGGKSGGTSGSTDKVLDRLRDKAAKTGDYTEVTAYKKKIRNKG